MKKQERSIKKSPVIEIHFIYKDEQGKKTFIETPKGQIWYDIYKKNSDNF